MPDATVIPTRIHPNVRKAVDWLTSSFGFAERLQIGEGHRSQLKFGDGAVIVADVRGDRRPPRPSDTSHMVVLRVDNLDALYERAVANGARVLQEPKDFEYGERQCTIADPYGHQWSLSQTLKDVAPEEWGGTSKA